MRGHREALDAATDAALAILGPRAYDAFRSEINSTLRAASSDDIGRLVRAGQVVREESAPGFPDAVGLTLVPEPAKAKSKREVESEQPTRRNTDDAHAREAAARAARQREREEKAEREREARRQKIVAARDAALARAERADADAARAQSRINTLTEQLAVAKRDHATAVDASRTATGEAARLATTRE